MDEEIKINYVTGNAGKVKLAKMIFKPLGVDVIQCDMETPEIQSESCLDVASVSAEYAANLLKTPVLKNDSGLWIEALNGFPGVYAKYAEATLKADGFIRLMEGIENRRCYWVEALAYAEPNHEPIVFESRTYGYIASSVRRGRGEEYDYIFIPEGDTRTFSEMSEEEQLKCFDTKAYEDLVNYLNNNN